MENYLLNIIIKLEFMIIFKKIFFNIDTYFLGEKKILEILKKKFKIKKRVGE